MTINGLFHVLAFVLLGAASSAYAETSYPHASNSPDWSSSRADSPYYDDMRHKPGYQNSNAGYIGADLPPSEYQPDARSREYQREKTAPMPPLDNGQYSSRPNPYCSGPLCGK